MAYFSDLSPYDYGHGSPPGVVHVGWLDNIHPHRKGIVASHLIEKMKKLATSPVECCRGFHVCELCAEPNIVKTSTGIVTGQYKEWLKPRSSNGEIRVSSGKITYAAPVLITHYIEEHGYLPPEEFLNAIEEDQAMSYYPDLRPYTFGRTLLPDVLQVGWLDNVHVYPKGPVAAHLIEKLKKLVASPVKSEREFHFCDLCAEPDMVKFKRFEGGQVTFTAEYQEWIKPRSNHGEIRVSAGDITFAAPVLIVHYIEDHGYLPPAEFLQAIEENPD
jgi:hypothetical protein